MFIEYCRAVLIGSLASMSSMVASAQAETLPVQVHGDFAHDKNKFALSGMDCLPEHANSRLCLVVDDELTAVQFATLSKTDTLAQYDLTVGEVVDLNLEGGEIVGKRPHKFTSMDCSGGEDDGELDGEAVTHIGTTFYVVGSHGCSRKKAEYKPQSFVLSRVATEDGKAAKPVNTYQLGRAILQSDILKSHFGKDLKGAQGGISIEGMTAGADGESLLIAFRSPSLDKYAFLMSVKIDPLFKEGDSLSPDDIHIYPVPLGADTGFRDIERLSDGRFLALVGSATEVSAPYMLRILAPDFSLQQETANVPATDGGSPEAIEWLGDGRVLILSDDRQNGGAVTVSAP